MAAKRAAKEEKRNSMLSCVDSEAPSSPHSLSFPDIDAGSMKSLNVSFDQISQNINLGHTRRVHTLVTKRLPKIPVNNFKMKKKYFTSRSWVNDSNQRDLLNEPSPFHYPKDLEECAHSVMTKTWRLEQRAKEMATKYNERHNHTSRQNVDLLNRLYVPEPEIKNTRYIQDIDPEYFKIIEGRPVPEKLRLREYIQTVRDVLRTKIVAGYRGDDILLLEESLILEQKHINDIMQSYKMYVNTFEAFLYKDHCESMRLLNEADKQSTLAREKYEEFRELSKEYGALKSIVTATEEKWRNCKMYQRFLYMVSPMSWRRDNDYFLRHEQELANRTGSGESLSRRDETDAGVASLDDLINQFQEDCATQESPILYFTDPNQLLDVFKFVELQNLNSLLHSEELAAPLEQVKESIAAAETRFKDEINQLGELIDKLEGGIKWEEERAKFLEELALQLVQGEFKDLVVAEEVLNLHVFVEDVYETRIGPNDANLTIGNMMKMVETKFRDELIVLDQLPADQVVRLEMACYREEAKMLKAAQRAARQLFEFEMLYQKLQKVFAPPIRRSTRELKWRSPPVNPPKPVPPPPRSLTETEKEFLEFFTDYCKHTDSPQQYGIDITPISLSKLPRETENELAKCTSNANATDHIKRI